MSVVATGQGWKSLEPILPGAPVGTVEFRQATTKFIREADPDVIVTSWPSRAFLPIGRCNRRTVARHTRLQHERNAQRRKVLSFIHTLHQWTRAHHKVRVGIAPRSGTTWSEVPIAASFAGDPSTTLQRGDVEVPYLVKGTKEVVEELKSFKGPLYDKEFAKRTIKGAERYLEKEAKRFKDTPREAFAVDDSEPEVGTLP